MKKFLIVLVLLTFAAPVVADDLFPPDFRGQPLSYEAHWDAFQNGNFGGFYTDYENSVDDSDPNTTLHNGFSTHLDFDPSDGWAMAPEGGGFYNPLTAATFVANVVNWIDEEPWKLLRIQVTYVDTLSNGPPIITDALGYDVPVGGPYVGGLFGEFGPIVLGLDPLTEYYYEDWFIEPNPDWEQIQFILPMGTIVEQIVIDTVSVPEPATMSLLALGGLAVLRRRRK